MKLREGKYTLYKLGNKMNVLREGSDHSTLTLARKDFESEEDFKKAVSDFLFILLKTDNIARVRKEEDLVIVDYTNDENLHAYGGSQLLFVTAEDAELINDNSDERILEDLINENNENNEDDENDIVDWYR